MNPEKTGLVLEGGGMRGIYVAGVLDVFLEQNIHVDGVIGVSAGAIHGCSFVAGQRERSIVPHNPLGPVSTAACLQLDAAIPNFGIQEFPSFYHQGNEAEMTTEPFREDGGYILIDLFKCD